MAITFVEQKHNTKTSQNGFPISIYQEELSHELYFIAINMEGWAIIGPNKKIVVTYVIRLIHVNMKAGKEVLLQSMPHVFSED